MRSISQNAFRRLGRQRATARADTYYRRIVFMQNTTKQALEAALKNMLLKKPLDKITIQDLTSDCGISRMAFYYHFKDIYDLVEWACYEDAAKALQEIGRAHV